MFPFFNNRSTVRPQTLEKTCNICDNISNTMVSKYEFWIISFIRRETINLNLLHFVFQLSKQTCC